MKLFANIALQLNKRLVVSTYAPMVGKDSAFFYLWDNGFRVSKHRFLGIKFLKWTK
jgi:hypothetical protein